MSDVQQKARDMVNLHVIGNRTELIDYLRGEHIQKERAEELAREQIDAHHDEDAAAIFGASFALMCGER